MYLAAAGVVVLAFVVYWLFPRAFPQSSVQRQG
jgi:hypothetical protein